jgi:hypothetical protein
MSGAKAILGIVAGGAGLLSLSIQLGQCAFKLNQIYHATKDAPNTVSRLASDLQTISLALHELDQQRLSTYNDNLLLCCIRQCQDSTAEIQQLIHMMEAQLAKHPRVGGRLYTVFREPKVKELLDRIDRTRGSLQLAYMMYLGNQQLQYHKTLAKHSSILEDLRDQLAARCLSPFREPLLPSHRTGQPSALQQRSPTLAASHELIHKAEEPRKKNKKTTVFKFRAYAPAFISSLVWEIAVHRSLGQWNINLRTWNSVSWNALIFRYCRSGNLGKVKQLLAKGEASPFDLAKGTYTLLDVSQPSKMFDQTDTILVCGDFKVVESVPICSWSYNLARRRPDWRNGGLGPIR